MASGWEFIRDPVGSVVSRKACNPLNRKSPNKVLAHLPSVSVDLPFIFCSFSLFLTLLRLHSRSITFPCKVCKSIAFSILRKLRNYHHNLNLERSQDAPKETPFSLEVTFISSACPPRLRELLLCLLCGHPRLPGPCPAMQSRDVHFWVTDWRLA